MNNLFTFLYTLFSVSKTPKVIRDAMNDDPSAEKDVIIGKLKVASEGKPNPTLPNSCEIPRCPDDYSSG